MIQRLLNQEVGISFKLFRGAWNTFVRIERSKQKRRLSEVYKRLREYNSYQSARNSLVGESFQGTYFSLVNLGDDKTRDSANQDPEGTLDFFKRMGLLLLPQHFILGQTSAEKEKLDQQVLEGRIFRLDYELPREIRGCIDGSGVNFRDDIYLHGSTLNPNFYSRNEVTGATQWDRNYKGTFKKIVTADNKLLQVGGFEMRPSVV